MKVTITQNNRPKNSDFSALVWQEGVWFVAKALEVEVASQGKSKSEALANLKEALELYFEDESSTRIFTPFVSASIEKISIRSSSYA